ncbi:hypothetical protein MTO96_028713 [Rhipicephalus appendiculatus]
MQADQLYSLEDENSLVIPQIRGLSVPMAVSSIRRHIAAIPDLEDRLRCVCEFYVCLMNKGLIAPWVLYHLGDNQGAAEATHVINYLEKAHFNRGFAHSTCATRERTHMCALVLESDTPSASYEIYCFCFWPSLASVAVYRPPEGYSVGQIYVIGTILGDDPSAFECGLYEELDLAHQDATFLACVQEDEEL